MPRKLRHCQGYSGMRWISATKLRYRATVTCADGHGWPHPAGLYASDLLVGRGGSDIRSRFHVATCFKQMDIGAEHASFRKNKVGYLQPHS